MAHPNEQVIRSAVAAFQQGNLDEFLGYLSDDLMVHVPGSNLITGDYKSKQDFVDRFVGTVMSLTGGQFRPEIHDVLGNDEHVTGIYTFTATRDGKTLEWPHVNVYHVADGKITEVFWVPANFEAWNAFWS